MASVGRKKDTCWKPKIQILAGKNIPFLAGKKSASGEFFFVPRKVLQYLTFIARFLYFYELR